MCAIIKTAVKNCVIDRGCKHGGGGHILMSVSLVSVSINALGNSIQINFHLFVVGYILICSVSMYMQFAI